MLNLIIFSKDRACQLELLIRSMKKFFKEFNHTPINILYTYSNNDYKKGYDKLFGLHSGNNILYIKESNFRLQTINLINISNPFTIFFVDDNIFKENFSLIDEQFRIFADDLNILTLSLRLHPRLSYCYPTNSIMTKPKFNSKLIYNWTTERGDYGYPMSLDGHFFRTIEIKNLSNSIMFNNPNSYEFNLSRIPLNGNKIICYDKSIIVNNPINKVQTNNNNRFGNITSKYLNDNFLNNKIINIDKYCHIDNISCHQELPVEFIDL